VKLIKYVALIAALALGLAACAFTSPNGTHVIYNPKGAATVWCIDAQGCIGADAAWYPYHAQVPTVAPAPTPPPPPAPPPPPPPPPQEKFKLAAGLWHTFGTAPGAAQCTFSRLDSEGHVIMTVNSVSGARYVETGPLDSEFQTNGCQTWVRAGGPDDVQFLGTQPPACVQGAGIPHLIHGNGDYLLGNQNWCPQFAPPDFDGGVRTPDWPAGLFQLNGSPSCRFEVVRNFKGENGPVPSLWYAGDGTGTNPVNGPNGPGNSLSITHAVQDMGFGLRLFNCGGTVNGDIYWYG